MKGGKDGAFYVFPLEVRCQVDQRDSRIEIFSSSDTIPDRGELYIDLRDREKLSVETGPQSI